MIHRAIITVPENANNTIIFNGFIANDIAPLLLPLGYELVNLDYRGFKHIDTGIYLTMRSVYNNTLGFSVGYNINQYGSIVDPFIVNDRIITHKLNDTADGFGIVQLTWCTDEDVTWIAFSGYNQIDTIPGGVILNINDKQVDTANGNVYQGSSSPLGIITPVIRNFASLPGKTHISDAYLVNGSFILENVPSIKGFASAEIQTYRLYDINGQRYLAIPNNLLIKC